MDIDVQSYQKLAIQIKDTDIRLKHLREDYDARVIAITPETGWPGKNADERDTAKARAEASDSALFSLRELIRDAESKLAGYEGDMAAFEIARREREWQVREQIVAALREKGISEALPF